MDKVHIKRYSEAFKKTVVKELEAALAQLTLDKMMLETTIEVASELYGEDIKKKYAPKSLNEPIIKGKKRESG